jgi:Chromo (CHRromatin Organisation MOdifier) domain
VRVTSDRVTRAPFGKPYSAADPEAVSSPSQDAPTPTSQANTNIPPRNQRPKKTVRFTLPEPEPEAEREYVVERIVDAQSDDVGQPLYRVRWMGYSPEEDTWEPTGNLPSHFIRRYWRTRLDPTRPILA